jgi:hypothetical protein
VPSLFARVTGVVFSPRKTFAAIADAPHWLGVLLLTTVVTFACSAAFLQTTVGRLALVDQWERTAIGFGGQVDDAEYARFQQLSDQGVAYSAITSLMSGPVLTVVLAALLTVVARARFRSAVAFRQLLAIVAHAGVILAVRQIVATPLQYVTESLASPTTLVRLAGNLDEANPLARFLGSVDVFVIWWIVVLAIGVGAAARRPARALALGFAAIYIVLAAVLAATMALTGGTA